MDSIDLSELSLADPSPPQSDQSSFGDASPLSPKLRDKLDRLAKWRIDPCLIEFPDDASKFEGGHATVSRALLTPASKNDQVEPRPRDKKKVVAVKKLKFEDGNSSEKVLQLALREAGILVGLSSRFIIKLDGFVEDLPRNRIWLIFPWEEYGNLKDFVASQDWEIPERISLINDVTRGVSYLHSCSPPIYHGDLKSINVLVNSKCRAVITDFGSARRLVAKDADSRMKRTEQTEAKPPLDFHATFCTTSNTMTFTGNEYTLRWAAPELLMDEEPGLSSDIWALGWIFYEVMTNSVPFENVQKESMVIKHVVDGRLPCVTDHIRVSLILQLSLLMIKCWDVHPTQRPTAGECRKFLDWMPAVVPVPHRDSDQANSRARSPELLMRLGDMYYEQSDYINASKLYTEALNIYTESSNNAGMADALYGLGRVHGDQSRYGKAASFCSKAVENYTIAGDKRGRSLALLGLAVLYSNQNEFTKAIPLYSEVIQIFMDINDQWRRADALRALGSVHRVQNDYDKAVNCCSEAVEISTNLGNMFGRSMALTELAKALRLQSKYSEAFALFSESLKASTDIGNKFGRASALWGLAEIHRDQDRPHDALRHYEEAAEIFKLLGNTQSLAMVSDDAARVYDAPFVQKFRTRENSHPPYKKPPPGFLAPKSLKMNDRGKFPWILAEGALHKGRGFSRNTNSRGAATTRAYFRDGPTASTFSRWNQICGVFEGLPERGLLAA